MEKFLAELQNRVKVSGCQVIHLHIWPDTIHAGTLRNDNYKNRTPAETAMFLESIKPRNELLYRKFKL